MVEHLVDSTGNDVAVCECREICLDYRTSGERGHLNSGSPGVFHVRSEAVVVAVSVTADDASYGEYITACGAACYQRSIFITSVTGENGLEFAVCVIDLGIRAILS